MSPQGGIGVKAVVKAVVKVVVILLVKHSHSVWQENQSLMKNLEWI